MAIAKEGFEVDLLWKSNDYADIFWNRTPRINYWYSVENAILIDSDGYCYSNYQNANQLLTSIIRDLGQITALFK